MRTHCSICREPVGKKKRWGKKPRAAPPPEQFPTQPQPESRAPSFAPQEVPPKPAAAPSVPQHLPPTHSEQPEPDPLDVVPPPELISPPGDGDTVSCPPAKALNPLLDDVEPISQSPEPPLPSAVTTVPQFSEPNETTASNHELSEDELRRRHLEKLADEARAKRSTDTFEFGSLRLGCGFLLFLALQVLAFARMPGNPTPAQIGWRVGGLVGGTIGFFVYGIWRATRNNR